MTPVPHYKYFKPHRIDIIDSDTTSYSTDRLGEDLDIRYGFGHCSRINRSHIEVVEIDFSWLGVIFHIVRTSEIDEEGWAAVKAAQNDIEAMKRLSRGIVLEYFREHPEEHENLLEKLHEGSRNQGRLELAMGTVRLLDPSLDLARP